jgi:hypothetical protein
MTEWLPSGKMGVYLTRLDMQGPRPTTITCKNVGRTMTLQLITEPNPQRLKWSVRWNAQQQWKITKSWHHEHIPDDQLYGLTRPNGWREVLRRVGWIYRVM